ncbi:MAG: DUF4358 domain-containing protein [Oscillospiraceae bacterium]|nr:DUF4358 domain-containing protein [Oscillospiraceae bacterium]
MLKRILFMIIVLTIVFTVLACDIIKNADLTDKDIESMIDELKNSEVFSEDIEKIGDNSVAVIYSIAESAETSICYSGISGLKAEEISVFKAKTEEDAVSFCAYLEAYRDSRLKQFENYAPAEAPKLRDAIIKRSGLYVIYAVTDNSVKASQIIDSYPKK